MKKLDHCNQDKDSVNVLFVQILWNEVSWMGAGCVQSYPWINCHIDDKIRGTFHMFGSSPVLSLVMSEWSQQIGSNWRNDVTSQQQAFKFKGLAAWTLHSPDRLSWLNGWRLIHTMYHYIHLIFSKVFYWLQFWNTLPGCDVFKYWDNR